MYDLLDAAGRPYRSPRPGSVGGHRRSRIYGRLDCPSALRALARGGYAPHRVFFADEATAIAAGYRPCAVCRPEQYRRWRGTLEPMAPVIRIEPWGPVDRPLLERANTPGMTEYLGGPETPEQLDARHERYLRLGREGRARMFTIVADGVPVGGIGWWDSRWRDAPAQEAGWFLVPEEQGRGTASAALTLLIEDARTHGRHDLLTAFPSRSNAASNALCRRAGFELRGQEAFPFRGITLEVNVWSLGLRE